MTWWLTIKTIHVLSAAVSIGLFVLRGIWMMRDSPRRRARWARIVPHVNDTILLVSAIGLALLTYQYPLVHGWLTAKVIGLFVYIGLGLVALRFGRTRRVRTLAWVAAVAVFVYIVSVALTRSPLPLGV